MLVQRLHRSSNRLPIDFVPLRSQPHRPQFQFQVDDRSLPRTVFGMPERVLVFAMEFLQIDNFHLLEIVKLFHVTTMTTAMPPFGYLILPLEFIGSQSRSLKSSLDGISDLSLFLCEGWHFRGVLLDFIGIFAIASLGGIAFGVVSGLVPLFFYFRFEEVKGFIH